MPFFLGKNRKSFGPFESGELEALRASGELDSYRWILEEGGAQWMPLEPAPPLPPSMARGARAARARALPSRPGLRVILFDHGHAVPGFLLTAHDGGCEISSARGGTGGESSAAFAIREIAGLVIHDARRNEAVRLRVCIDAITRGTEGKKGWNYRLSWAKAPALLAG